MQAMVIACRTELLLAAFFKEAAHQRGKRLSRVCLESDDTEVIRHHSAFSLPRRVHAAFVRRSSSPTMAPPISAVETFVMPSCMMS